MATMTTKKRSASRKQPLSTVKDISEFDHLAEIFSALGSAPRLRMLFLLHQNPDLTVGELSRILGISISGVSMHLRRLRATNLVSCRRDGQAVCCALQGADKNTRFLRELFRRLAEETGCCVC